VQLGGPEPMVCYEFCQQKMFKEMLAEENLARSEAREREETVSDEEMAKR